MKKYLLVATGFFISISCCIAQTKLTGRQASVQNTVLKIFEALANLDTVNL